MTSLWFTKSLGDAMLADASLEHLRSLFQAMYPLPADETALFFRHESEGRLHCEVWVYFSPSSRSIAQAVNATPSHKPFSPGLSLLAGSPFSFAVLFPDAEM